MRDNRESFISCPTNNVAIRLPTIRDEYHDSRVIKNAFLDAIEIMGERGKAAFIEDLQLKGLDLDDKRLSLPGLALTVRSLFGDDVSDLIMQRVMIKLDEMYGKAIQKSGRVRDGFWLREVLFV